MDRRDETECRSSHAECYIPPRRGEDDDTTVPGDVWRACDTCHYPRMEQQGHADQSLWYSSSRQPLVRSAAEAPQIGPCDASSIIAFILHPKSEANILGRATDHASIHILDASGHPVATGAEGEIYCTRASVALGYLGEDGSIHQSFQTVSSFSPSLPCKGSVIYATRDYGKFTSCCC
jgi:hypothetical protein